MSKYLHLVVTADVWTDRQTVWTNGRSSSVAVVGVYLVQDRNNGVKSGSLGGILIHTDFDEFGEVGGCPRWNRNSQVFKSHL